MVVEYLNKSEGQLRKFGIHLGVPILFEETGNIMVPKRPHVFFCNEFFLMMPLEKRDELVGNVGNIALPLREILMESGEQKYAVVFKEVMVMLGHGLVWGPNEKDWVFQGTNKAVSETAKTYEKVAKQVNWPNLDMIVACRAIDVEQRKGVRFTLSRGRTPCIYPDDTAHLLNINAEVDSRFKPDKTTVAIEANSWIGIKPWLDYWSVFNRPLNFPDWARNSRQSL